MVQKLKFNDGSVQKINEITEDIRRKYKEVFEIDPMALIRITAHRGKWLDQSQSFNIFVSGISGKQLSDIYLYAWRMGLKTTYYLRSLAISQVEKSTVNAAEVGATHKRELASAIADTAPKPESNQTSLV
jgi:ribonucleoside-diphosphate reductase alpha chain